MLVSIALKRSVQILDIDPVIPFTKSILQHIVSKQIARGRAHWAIDGIDDLKRVKDVPGKTLLYNVFGEIEPWQNEYFGFSRLDRTIGNYALATKQVITNYIGEKHVSLLVLREIFRQGDTSKADAYECIGMHGATKSVSEFYCRRSLQPRAAWIPARIINFVIGGAILLHSLKWIATHIRLGKADKSFVFCAADFIGDERDCRLYRELEDGGPMLMVPRGWGRASPLASRLEDYEFCDMNMGFLQIKDLFGALAMVLIDQWRIYRHLGSIFPGIYLRLAKLPYSRLLYRGLFSRYDIKYFWGRDPYNAEHIIRRQEINRAGGKSFGVNTGYLTWSILIDPWRYISFDRFYVFGRGKYEKYYGDTWAKDMAIIPAGSFTAERRHYAHRFDDRPLDIAVFTSVFIGEPELMGFIRGLARIFTDRKIILQTKDNFDDMPGQREFIDGCQQGLPNVEFSTDSVYDIFMRVRYGFSDPSSVVAEALQFGVMSFAFDMPELQMENVNREYPGLTVTNTEEAANAIRAIEAGEKRYPIEKFRNVVDMSGKVFYDRIREDMGLSPREQSASLIEHWDTESVVARTPDKQQNLTL